MTSRYIGLTLRGPGPNATGIGIVSGGRISVENCDSRNFAYGLTYFSSTPSSLRVKGGIYQGSNTGIFLASRDNIVNVDGVTVYGGDGWAGINADGNDITITHSLISGNGGPYGVFVINFARVVLESDIITHFNEGAVGNGRVYFSGCTITNNGTGIDTGFGPYYSRGNNTIVGNVTDVYGALIPFSAQ